MVIDADPVAKNTRSLWFGPVRTRRQFCSVFYSLLLAVPLGDWTARIGFGAIFLAVGIALMLRARAMRVEITGDTLLIKNMFLSDSVPLSDIRHVALSRPVTPGQTSVTEVTTTSGRVYRAAGLSVSSDPFTPKRRFRGKRAVAQVELAREFFQQSRIDFLRPPS
jgi:hypothetical protein